MTYSHGLAPKRSALWGAVVSAASLFAAGGIYVSAQSYVNAQPELRGAKIELWRSPLFVTLLTVSGIGVGIASDWAVESYRSRGSRGIAGSPNEVERVASAAFNEELASPGHAPASTIEAAAVPVPVPQAGLGSQPEGSPGAVRTAEAEEEEGAEEEDFHDLYQANF